MTTDLTASMILRLDGLAFMSARRPGTVYAFASAGAGGTPALPGTELTSQSANAFFIAAAVAAQASSRGRARKAALNGSA